MGWTAPTDRTTGYVVTSADWNIVEDNLTFLAGTLGAQVVTSETTTSSTYTDLATIGPAVTVTTGAHALVIISVQASNSIAGDGAIMSFAISGATTIAASDNWLATVATTSAATVSSVNYVSITAGSNTFTAKYRISAGGTGTFARRSIAVIPLP